MKMKKEIKIGMLIAYQGVKEKMSSIVAELKRKGIDKPKGFSTLEQFIEDSIRDTSGIKENEISHIETDKISRQYAIEQTEMAIEEADDEKEKEYLKRFIEFLRVLPYAGEDGNLKWEGYGD